MKIFQNILVGVDLSRYRPGTDLGPIAREAIERGILLAGLNSARLLFLSALNLTEETLHMLPAEERQHISQTVRGTAEGALQEFVIQAQKQGVQAAGKVVNGKGWQQILEQVLRDQHDLVIVGTRDQTGLRRLLFGNTAMKLLRRCPVPVLVVKVGTNVRPMNILAATDLKPAGQQALQVAVRLAQQLEAYLHVLHVVEYPLDRIWSTGLMETRENAYHKHVRDDAEQRLEAQLKAADAAALGERLQPHLADGVAVADVAIQNFINLHNIHLLVMGTLGRSGLPGVMIGNTAERVLPEVHCSVLGVKPPDFQLPAQLE